MIYTQFLDDRGGIVGDVTVTRLGGDLTPMENPYEARLGFCVNTRDDDDFNGKQALLKIQAAGAARRLVTLTIDGEEHQTIYGGEAVTANGKVVSRLQFGFA